MKNETLLNKSIKLINNYFNKHKIIIEITENVFSGKVKPDKDLITKYRGAINKSELNKLFLTWDTQICIKIEKLIKKNKFDGSTKLLRELILDESKNNLNQTIEFAKLQNCLKHVKDFLKIGDFRSADSFMKKNGCFEGEVKELTMRFVRDFFHNELSVDLDKDKIAAIADCNKHQIVKARAGSGKTTFLAYKTKFLIEKLGIKPSEILILTFNRGAAEEMRDRLKVVGLKDFKNTMTFHSLAYNLVQPNNLLSDDKQQSAFIENILCDELSTKTFHDIIYRFFRKEIDQKEVDHICSELDKKTALYYLKNLKQITLGQETVKSRGEKYIADFLFEHNLNYQYEKTYKWDGKNYRPDFVIMDEQGKDVLVIEYWGMKKDSDMKRRKQYEDQIVRKQKFWSEMGIPLLEVEFKEIDMGRSSFEKNFSEKLSSRIRFVRLTEEEIIKKIIGLSSTHFLRLVFQFIKKAKKSDMSPEKMQEKIKSRSLPQRIEMFTLFSNHIYKLYEKKLKEEDSTDFDNLLKESIAKIVSGKNELLKFKELKYIFIDEYQDFSELFYKILE